MPRFEVMIALVFKLVMRSRAELVGKSHDAPKRDPNLTHYLYGYNKTYDLTLEFNLYR
jgi:hypothetical protein